MRRRPAVKINWQQMWSLEEEKASPEDQERMQKVMDSIAGSAVKRSLGGAALWFAESFKPLSFIGSQAMVFFNPAAEFLGFGKKYQSLIDILSSREQTQNLISALECALDAENKDDK